MKIHFKALLIFAVAMVGLFTLVFILSTKMVLGAYEAIESAQMRQLAMRFTVIMDDRETRIRTIVRDWLPWSRINRSVSADFSERPDLEKLNFDGINTELLKSLQLDFLFLVDGRGELIGGSQLSADPLPTAVPMEDWLVRRLQNAGFFPTRHQDGSTAGKLLVGNKVCAIAAYPVMANAQSDSAPSAVVGGAFFDQSEIRRIERGSDFSLKFLPLTGERTNEDWDKIRADLLTTAGPVVSVIDDQWIAVYTIITDVRGTPTFIAKLTSPRTLYQAGKQMVGVFLVAFTFAGGTLFLVVFFGLDKAVLSPIRRLQMKVESAGIDSETPLRLGMGGNDEISMLAGKVEDLAASLFESRARYRAVVESQRDLICRHKPNGPITFANLAFLSFFQVTESECRTRTLCEILNAFGQLSIDPEHVEQISAQPVEFELQIDTPAGRLWLLQTSMGIFDSDGVLTEIQDIFRNVTERRTAQLRLQESEVRYRTLFENDWDGIVIIDSETKAVIDVNVSFCELFAQPKSEFLGHRFDELPGFDSFSRIDQLQDLPRHRRINRAQMLRLDCPGQAPIFADVVVSSYPSGGRTIIQWNLRDVTERLKTDEQLRSLSARLLDLQDQERRRIARELHDSTGQNLSAMQMTLSRLENSLVGQSSEARDLIHETRELLDQSCAEIRTMSYLLHPPLLDEMGLIFALEWFVDGFGRRTNTTVDVDIDHDIGRMPAEVETALYRIVQEAFNNIHRHTQGARCSISLRKNAQGVTLEIQDFGSGISSERMHVIESGVSSLGVGLLGMRERVKQLNGTFTMLSGSTGTSIKVILPHVAESLRQR